MRRRQLKAAAGALAGAAVLACAGLGGAATAAGARAASVPVVRCHTVFGVSQPPPKTPARLDVSPAVGSTSGLVAYTNTDLYLLAPAGMSCAGIVAADGGSEVAAWPKGRLRPRGANGAAGLSLHLEPACSSCRASLACPFFPALARRLEFPCRAGAPASEKVERHSARLVLFEDPPGVRGSGDGSGGRYASSGLAEIFGPQEVLRDSCTLPASRRRVCTKSLNETLSVYA